MKKQPIITALLIMTIGMVAPSIAHATGAGIDAEDRDQGMVMNDNVTPTELCNARLATMKYADPAATCMQAYLDAEVKKDPLAMMKAAYVGCADWGNVGGCRTLSRMPGNMAAEGIPVPTVFTEAIINAADKVCSGKVAVQGSAGTIVNGRECANFARMFGLAKDPEGQFINAKALIWYQKIYDQSRSAQLTRAACDKFKHADSCEALKVNTTTATKISWADYDKTQILVDAEAGSYARQQMNVAARSK